MLTDDTKELRVFKLPIYVHLKIERYMSLIHSRTGRKLTKDMASAELLEKATRNIKLPTE